MRVVIQRVSHASVTIEGVCKSAIKEGFMILVGIEEADTQEDADWLCKTKELPTNPFIHPFQVITGFR